jgi:hypothetical protein
MEPALTSRTVPVIAAVVEPLCVIQFLLAFPVANNRYDSAQQARPAVMDSAPT